MKRLLTILFFVVVFSLPQLSLAAFGDPIVPCDGPGCRACDVVTLGQNLLTWLIGIMASIIALVFAFGGVKMVMSGGNSGEVSKAKGMMTNAVIGFVILLAGWLIVDTILKTFVSNSKFGPWYEIKCVAPLPTITPTPGGTPGGVTPPTSTTTAACSDDAALIAKYHGSPVGVEDPGLSALKNCYLADPEVKKMVDMNKLYTIDRSHPRCSLTNGNEICGECSHGLNSCHYGRGHGTGAMAIDFNANSNYNEGQLYNRLNIVQATCGGRLAPEGDHSHVSMSSC